MKTHTASEKDKALPNPPEEQISAVRFLPPSKDGEELFVAATSWDGSLRVWDFKQETLILNEKYCKDGMPILGLAAVGSHSLAFGGLDRCVYVLEFSYESEKKSEVSNIGAHEGSVTAVEFSTDQNVILTGGKDSKVKMWSYKPGTKDTPLVGSIALNGHVFAMNARGHLLAVGLSDGTAGIWDIRNVKESLKIITVKDTLNLQCLAIFPDMKRFVYGTNEGKASVETIDKQGSGGEFLFKPQVDKVKGIAHPVNAVSFIEGTSRFLMGGSDGKLKIWDPNTRKLVADFPRYPNEIAAIATSSSGKYAAVACSYLDDRELKDENDVPPIDVYIRSVAEYSPK